MKGLAANLADTIFARAQRSKVLSRFGDNIVKEFHGDTASLFAVDFHVKIHLRVSLVCSHFQGDFVQFGVASTAVCA